MLSLPHGGLPIRVRPGRSQSHEIAFYSDEVTPSRTRPDIVQIKHEFDFLVEQESRPQVSVPARPFLDSTRHCKAHTNCRESDSELRCSLDTPEMGWAYTR